jgi:hypothetical protein
MERVEQRAWKRIKNYSKLEQVKMKTIAKN